MSSSLPRTFWLLILASSLCITVGIYYDARHPRRSIQEISEWGSSAFRRPGQPDPFKPPTPDQYAPISTPHFTFYINIPDGKQTIKVAFRYRCQPACSQLWFSLDSQPNTPVPRFLIHHPILNHLTWLPIADQNLYIYQRQLKYRSIAEILADPPSTPILTEQSIIDARQLQQLNYQLLEDATDLGDAEVIITTYQTPRFNGEWGSFSRLIQVTAAERNDQGQLIAHIDTQSPDPQFQLFMTYPHIEYQN